jgi:hypothetical protein
MNKLFIVKEIQNASYKSYRRIYRNPNRLQPIRRPILTNLDDPLRRANNRYSNVGRRNQNPYRSRT